METKWTPGPWQVIDTVSDDLYVVIPRGENFQSIARVFHNAQKVDEARQANANLIAAAPDLYKALEELANAYVGEKGWEDAYAALAKARGEGGGIADVSASLG